MANPIALPTGTGLRRHRQIRLPVSHGEADSCEGFGVGSGEAHDMKREDEADVEKGRDDRKRKGPNHVRGKPAPLRILITKAGTFPWIGFLFIATKRMFIDTNAESHHWDSPVR